VRRTISHFTARFLLRAGSDKWPNFYFERRSVWTNENAELPKLPSRGRTFFSLKYSKFDKWIILIYIFSPKASPLDIVWSRKVTLLLSTWA
jgi:hypothetical protein